MKRQNCFKRQLFPCEDKGIQLLIREATPGAAATVGEEFKSHSRENCWRGSGGVEESWGIGLAGKVKERDGRSRGKGTSEKREK